MKTDTLRVGQFITQYPYEDQFSGANDYFCSGAERVAKHLSEGLVERGCDVTVCTSSATFERSITEQNGVTVHRSPSITRINTTQIAPTQIIAPIIDELEFDVVHAHNSTPPGVIAAWLYAKWNDVPFVVTHHGGEKYESHGSIVRRAGLYAYTKFLIDRLFQSADVSVSPTAGYIEESTALSSAPEVEIIPNGVDIGKFDVGLTTDEAKEQLGIDPDTFLVLYLGSLHPRKGVDVLLDGFLRFHDDHPNSSLVIGGSGALKQKLDSKIEDSPASNAIQLPGFIPESEKPVFMTAADVFVLPSITAGSEVYPLVLLEAAAAGTPVIASRFETIESVVNPNDIGTFLDPGSVQSVTDELERFFEEEKMRDQMAENAYQTAREREWTAIAEQYNELYRSLLT